MKYPWVYPILISMQSTKTSLWVTWLLPVMCSAKYTPPGKIPNYSQNPNCSEFSVYFVWFVTLNWHIFHSKNMLQLNLIWVEYKNGINDEVAKLFIWMDK